MPVNQRYDRLIGHWSCGGHGCSRRTSYWSIATVFSKIDLDQSESILPSFEYDLGSLYIDNTIYKWLVNNRMYLGITGEDAPACWSSSIRIYPLNTPDSTSLPLSTRNFYLLQSRMNNCKVWLEKNLWWKSQAISNSRKALFRWVYWSGGTIDLGSKSIHANRAQTWLTKNWGHLMALVPGPGTEWSWDNKRIEQGQSDISWWPLEDVWTTAIKVLETNIWIIVREV